MPGRSEVRKVRLSATEVGRLTPTPRAATMSQPGVDPTRPACRDPPTARPRTGRPLDAKPTAPDTPRDGSRPVWAWAALFGLLSFFQGVAEPTEGVVSQPVRSWLLAAGMRGGEVTGFAAALSLPWALKPFLGLLTDFVPVAGSRRRSYLVASGTLTAAAFLAAWAPGQSRGAVAAALLAATLGMTMADVATDALVVDRGRASGQTGRFQASVWIAVYASGVVTGPAGGALAARGKTREALLIGCAASAAVAALAVAAREPNASGPATGLRPGGLPRALTSRRVLGVAAFLAVANFNPFSNAFVHLHATAGLGLGEQFFGDTVAVYSVASMAAAAGYGAISRRFPIDALARGSVALLVASALAYGAFRDRPSALAVTVVVGLASMTATLVQFELAALACPPEASGTVFATFMAVSNLSTSLATWAGGHAYEAIGGSWGRPAAFRALVVATALISACCGFLVPRDRGR